MGAAGLGVAVAAMLAAYVVAGSTGQFTAGAAVAAVALLTMTAAGILYAWRPVSGRLD